MSGPSEARATGGRADLEARVLAPLLSLDAATASLSATDAPPLLLVQAPRGYGKSGILDRIDARLRESGRRVVRCDMDAAGTAADLARGFPVVVADALLGAGARVAPETHPRAAAVASAIDAAIAMRPIEPTRLLDLTFSFPQALAEDTGGLVLLIIDAIGEVMRVTHHAETREAIGVMARRLAISDRLALLASLSPASRAGAFTELLAAEALSAGRVLHILDIPPLAEGDLPHSIDAGVRAGLLAVTAGRPLHVEHLLARLRAGASLQEAILETMTPPSGLLWQECHFDYHHLVDRCRGDAAVRSVLMLLAATEGRTLTEIARHLRIAPPTALDYLRWMHEVALIRRRDKIYILADPLLRIWILLRAIPKGEGDAPIREAIVNRVLEEASREAPAPAAGASPGYADLRQQMRARGPRTQGQRERAPTPRAEPPPAPALSPEAADPPPDSTDLLMEID